MESEFKQYLRRILRYFLQGLLLIGPLMVTIWLIIKVFRFFDGLLPFRIPGLGVVVVIVFITLVGFIGSTIIAKPITRYLQRTIDRIPLIKVIYSSVKDLLSAFVGKKKRFTEPVLVKVNRDSALEKLGFVTCRDLSLLGIEGTKVAVYLPHSYAFSGNLFVVPVENITPLNASSTNVMKFIVSGGVINPQNDASQTEISDENDKK